MRFHFPLSDQPPADLPGGLVDELYEALKEHSFEGGCTARMFLPFFDAAVERQGWTYQGPGRNRNRLICSLPTFAFYGHRNYRQRTTEAALALYPYWQLEISSCISGSCMETPPQHERVLNDINKLIVPADCDWIRAYLSLDGTHHAHPNVISWGRLERTGDEISEPPPLVYYQSNDPVTGAAVDVPVGVMPGFQKDIRSPMEDYVKHFIRLAMILPVSEKEEWY